MFPRWGKVGKYLRKYTNEKERELTHLQLPTIENDKKVLWLEYNDTSREILLNGVLLLSTPQYGSVNAEVFTYLYKHPNQGIDVQKMYKILGVDRKEPAKIFSDLNFTGDLAQLFFNASQKKIYFYNPISKQHIQKLFPNKKPRIFKKPTKSSD